MMHFTYTRHHLSVAIALVLYTNASHAEQHTVNTVSLAPIVVTANHGHQANGLIVTADPKQPIQPIPAVDGASYLQSIVGFNAVKSSGTVNSDITFRGMFGSRIKVLNNNSENLGACGGRMDAPTSYISPESFDQITVIKGPQTVRFSQPGSAATVLYDRGPVRFKAGQFYQGQASVVAGSYGRLDQNIDTAIGDENKYIRLMGNRSTSNDYKDGHGQRVHSSWEKWNADVALGFTPSDNTWIEATAGKSDGQVAYAGRGMDGTRFERESLGLRVQQKELTTWLKKIDLQVNYNLNDHVMDNYRLRPVKSMPMVSNVARKTITARAEATLEWGALSILTGIDHQYSSHSMRRGLNYPSLPRQTDMRFDSYGIFAEGTYALSDRQHIVTGLRADITHVQDERDKTKLFNQSRRSVLPSGFLRLESDYPEYHLNTYIGLGHVQRLPDYWELFSPVSIDGSSNVFNGVKPEKTTQFDLGYQYQNAALTHWASAYVGHVSDFILMQYGQGTHVTNVNAHIAGGEFGLGYQFTDHIDADLSAMYAWGKNTTQRRDLPQIAPFETRMNLRYRTEKYSIGALWRLVAAQNRYAEKQGNIVGYDLGPSAGFGTLSLNATYILAPTTQLAIGIDNVFDRYYTEHLNKLGNPNAGMIGTEQIYNIGRNYWARIQFKF
ncbi:TonB-dependent copper receptor [Acinetobacter apis]|uniref:Iron complex outermembrane recepter protein n=1 Tax=Acinetobacter apis TaxID=1229165 RepID=A0A217EE60_9GAMM|nr:TonB-dependent copper receptor [Acinetobacter apis]SNQ28587.1 iron complex outermembrane recepter protein [Acinetobacter apis]